jgi:hypothetical protein
LVVNHRLDDRMTGARLIAASLVVALVLIGVGAPGVG